MENAEDDQLIAFEHHGDHGTPVPANQTKARRNIVAKRAALRKDPKGTAESGQAREIRDRTPLSRFGLDAL